MSARAALALFLAFADSGGSAPLSWALRFSGRDASLAAPHVPLRDAKALTVEAWVKDWKGGILCQGKAGDPENSIWISTGSRPGVGVPHESCGFEAGAGANYELSVGFGPAGRWTHVAMLWADGELRVYLQGKPAGSLKAPVPGPFDASRDLVLGAHEYDKLTFGSGLLGPVRISSAARYSGAFVPAVRWPVDGDTLFQLPLTERRGDTAHDASGRRRHAMIRAAEWVPAPDLTSAP